MPEEGKSGVDSDCKFVKEIYLDSEAGSNFYIGKTAKETLGTFILKGFDEEKVILLMGSDCSTEDLMMDDEVLSDWSSEALFNIDNITSSVITGEELNGEKIDLSQGTCKEAEAKNRSPSPVIEDAESQDKVNEDMISYNNELDKEVQENVGIIQQYSGTLPYSGSISLRSTSSTASTQSFAFPILAQECNSSPVRMPKPNKRQLLTKPKQWKMKMSWVCCKF